MRVLVTGGAGLLGTELSLQLQQQGHKPIAIDNLSRFILLGESGPRQHEENLAALRAARVTFLGHDFRVLGPDLHDVNAVVHSAAQVCHSRKDIKDDPLEDLDVNVVGTVRLLRLCKLADVPMLFISSSKVYGQNFDVVRARHEDVALMGIDERCPLGDQTHLTFFGASKAAADLFCQMYGRKYGEPGLGRFRAGVFRPGCFTGRWALPTEVQNWLPWLVHCARRGEPFHLYGDGEQVRDLLHVRDLAGACIRWLEHPTNGVWNLGGGPRRAPTLNQAIDRVQAELGKRIQVEARSPRPGDIRYLVLDSSRFMHDYGWEPEKSHDDIYREACG